MKRITSYYLLFTITLLLISGNALSYSGVEGTCGDLTKKIADCKPYKCTHNHPNPKLIDETVEVEVVGRLSDDKCQIDQTMPENQFLTCKYSKEAYMALSRVVEKFFSEGEMRSSGNDEQILNKAFDDECQVTER